VRRASIFGKPTAAGDIGRLLAAQRKPIGLARQDATCRDAA
jgi:hypothetical protein